MIRPLCCKGGTMEIKSTRDQKGWLIPYLLGLDQMFFRRWDYWTRTCITGRVPREPIPAIPFQPPAAYPRKQVLKNLRRCLDYARSLSSPLEAFVDWLLWGFNQGETFPPISEKEDDFWYRTFNLGLFYLEPADHFGELAAEYMGRNNALGFFATPGSVVAMMVRMSFGAEPQDEHKTLSVCDPCCGTGGMLLYASNYSLNLYGMDISHLLTKIARLNGFIYVPWLVYRPRDLRILDHVAAPPLAIAGPGGIEIPRSRIGGDPPPYGRMDLETVHELRVSDGQIRVDSPGLAQDLRAKGRPPENVGRDPQIRKEGSP